MSDTKTEKPTDKRLRDAREKGQIAQSHELPSVAAFMALLLLFTFAGDWFWSRLIYIVELAIKPAEQDFSMHLRWLLTELGREFLIISALPLLLALIIIILVGGFQTSFLITFHPVIPNFENLDPIQGLKKIFSTRSLIGLVKNILKVGLFGTVVWLVVKNSVDEAVKLPYLATAAIPTMAFVLLKDIFIWSAIIYFVMAVVDYAHQKYEHIKANMMDKEEVKREYKDQEGDPHIKGKRKELFKEMAFNGMVQRARKASVMIVNPTHITVAIRYEAGETPLPIVVAKATDDKALILRKIAEKENIPILRNVKLARELYESSPIDRYVVTDLLEPVAEVLKWVKRLHEQKKQAQDSST
jgi:type III secretion protein U